MREKFRISKISKHRRLKMYIKEENPEILKQKYEALIAQRKQTPKSRRDSKYSEKQCPLMEAVWRKGN
jgi:hypothetical protein